MLESLKKWFKSDGSEKVWFVRRADRKGVTYWSNEEAALEFQKLHKGDASEPELIYKPVGVKVRDWPDDTQETKEDFKLLEVLKNFTPKDYEKMSVLELVQAHKKLFDTWVRRGKRRNDELVVNANLLILGEIKRRDSKAPKENELDELSKAWSVKAKKQAASVCEFNRSSLLSQTKEGITLISDDFPVKIKYGEMQYILIKTGQGKLRLGKEET